MSSTTTNKSLTVPAHGSFSNDWDVPVNANWQALDSALGGTTTISVTGVIGPTVLLTLTQYTPINIEFSGNATANLTYQVPAGVGGIWTVGNMGTGPYTLSFGVVGGAAIVLTAARTLVVSDGVNMSLCQSPITALSQLNGPLLNSQMVSSNVTQFEGDLAIIADQVVSGVFQVSQIPYVGTLPGVTIASDPGTTPSGVYGDIFFYY